MSENFWTFVISSLISVIFGGGGVGAFLTIKHQRERGIKEDALNEENSFTTRVQGMLQVQFEIFVQPLQKQVENQGKEIKALKEEVEAQKNKYWRAIAYVRAVLNWIDIHVPDPKHPPPQLHEDILKDL